METEKIETSPYFRFDQGGDMSAKVEQQLKKQQENKEFKDVGYIGGSAKERAAYRKLIKGENIQLDDLSNLETDKALVVEMVKKEKVYPKVDILKEQQAGVSAGAAYLKVKMRESFGSAPPDNAEKRKAYVGYVEYLVAKFEPVISVDEFQKASSGLISEGLSILIKILLGESAYERILSDRASNKRKYDELELERQHLDKQIKEDLERLEAKFNINDYPQFWAENKWFRVNELPQEEKARRFELNDKINENTRQKVGYNPDFTSIEQSFIDQLSLGKSYYSSYSIASVIFEEIFGKRFVSFITKKTDAALQTYEQARDYEAMTVPQSIKAIEENASWTIENLEDKKKQSEDISKLVTKEQHDAFFNEKSHGNTGFSGGDFSMWGRGYFYYKDLKGEKMIEAYKKRYLISLNNAIESIEKDLEAIKHKYRVRESDWDWAFSKTGAAQGNKEKAELKVNSYPPLFYIKREGGLLITDEDVNEDSIIQKFGFSRIQFGQSLKDREAREHIRHFLCAMADLGDILNMDIVQLNAIGNLSIAFASRGQGKASAHYESGHKVINITKTKGGGAIAHEYAHYLDNVLPSIDNPQYSIKDWASTTEEKSKYGYYGKKSVKNENVYNVIRDIFSYIKKADMRVLESLGVKNENKGPNLVKLKIEASEKSYRIPSHIQGDDIETYFQNFTRYYSNYAIVESLKKKELDVLGFIVHKFGFKEYEFTFKTFKTLFYSNSSAMSSDYWSRDWELFARAFETYIYDKLDKAGRVNNYLVSGSYFDRPEGVYPQGDERANLFLLYDKLMKTIKDEYKIADFKAWTTERVKEYITIDEDKKEETTDAGIIVDEQTDEVIVTIERTDEQLQEIKAGLRDKMKVLAVILDEHKSFSKGGELKNTTITDALNSYLLTLQKQ